jgi:hypothetical protein
MGYIFLALLVLGVIGTGAGYWRGSVEGEAKAAAKIEAAQAKIEQQAKEAQAAEVQKQAELVAAFDKGEANARVVTHTIYVKGQDNVAKDTGLSNPSCVMSDDSLLLLRGALAGMRTAADPTATVSAVSGAGTAGGQNLLGVVPEQPQEHGTVGGVHPASSATGPANTAGPRVVRQPPKPTPLR